MPTVPGAALYTPGGGARTGIAPAVPHLRFPFGLTVDGSVGVVAQDGEEEVTQCVAVLLQTIVGSRMAVPGYGIVDPTFGRPDPTAIGSAITTWEPRAAAQVSVVAAGDDGRGSIAVAVGLKDVL
ncbi:MAG: GPW/gp25 family protein [Actinomycetota bacterium]|nr:GPW/gp25 family protein [Actinomycetota bacterium]